MPRDKTQPKWPVPFFTIVVIILGAAIVFYVARGERPQWYLVVAFIVFAWVAFDSWRKRRKDADVP